MHLPEASPRRARVSSRTSSSSASQFSPKSSLLVDYSQQCARRVSESSSGVGGGGSQHERRRSSATRRRPSGGMVVYPQAPNLDELSSSEEKQTTDVQFSLSLKRTTSNGSSHHCRRQDVDDTTMTGSSTHYNDLDEDVAAIFGKDYSRRQRLRSSSTHNSFGREDNNSSRSSRSCRSSLQSSSLHNSISPRSQREKLHRTLLRRKTLAEDTMDSSSNTSSSGSNGGPAPFARKGSSIKRRAPRRREATMMDESETGDDPLVGVVGNSCSYHSEHLSRTYRSSLHRRSSHDNGRHNSVGETPLTLWTHSYHDQSSDCYPAHQDNNKEHHKQQQQQQQQQRMPLSLTDSQTMINDQFAALEALLGNCRGPEQTS